MAPAIELNPVMKATLDRLARSASTPQALALRSRIVLAAAAGQANQQIATALQVPEVTVGKWRRCFASQGLDGLQDAARSGRPPKHSQEILQKVQSRVCQQPEHYSRWSVRTLATDLGIGSQHRASDVGGFGSAAPSDSQLHVQSRSRFRGQTAGHRRPVLEPARPRAGVLRR